MSGQKIMTFSGPIENFRTFRGQKQSSKVLENEKQFPASSAGALGTMNKSLKFKGEESTMLAGIRYIH